jgi:3-(3-hydroxy-phenyl)propionate hydroxylase
LTQHEEYDVVIVGFGPTGQAASALLGRLGHRVAVFDKWPARYGHPRLISIDGDSIRVIQASGGDLDVALNESAPMTRYLTVNDDGDVLLDIDWSKGGIPHVCGFPQKIEMYQPHIEEAMDVAGRGFGVDVNQGWVVTDFREEGDRIIVDAKPRAIPGQGEGRTLTTRYLIGADGANSTVRERLGIERQDFEFGDGWLSVDIVKKRELPDRFQIPTITLSPGRTHAAIRMGTKRMRFEFVVDPREDNEHLLVHEVGYQFLKDTYGLTPDDVEIFRQVLYPFDAKLAHEWRRGRAFLAGDAAHLMPPFLGEGACSGLRDAITLSTKLDLVLKGISDESLLDTYAEERRPDVSQYLEGSVELGRIVLERDPVKAAERDAAMKRGEGLVAPPDPVLRTGVVHADENGEHGPAVGTFSPQGIVTWQDKEGRFDDIVGWGYTLVVRDQDPLANLDDGQQAFLEEIGCVCVGVSDRGSDDLVADTGGDYRRFFDENGIVAFLARPDFWIFGSTDSVDDIPAIVDDLSEQLRGVPARSSGARLTPGAS